MNVTNAEPLHWGRGQGCPFATGDCGNWLAQTAQPGHSAEGGVSDETGRYAS